MLQEWLNKVRTRTVRGPITFETVPAADVYVPARLGGIVLPPSPLRDRIDELFPQRSKNPAAFSNRADKLNSLKEINLVPDTQRVNVNFRCATFVFGHCLKEPWWDDPNVCRGRTNEFLEEADIILASQGYEIAADPQQADVIVYYGWDDSHLESEIYWGGQPVYEAVHVGVMIKPGLVLSKFGHAPVYRHAIDAVPTWYGEEYKLWKKVSYTAPDGPLQ